MTNSEMTRNTFNNMSEDHMFDALTFTQWQSVKTNFFNYMMTYETADQVTYQQAILNAVMNANDAVQLYTQAA